jgi:flagellar P-ring protein precursor FlgI
MMTRHPARLLLLGIMITLLINVHCRASDEVRIRDLTEVEGVRTNQLVGLGLVTGLNGTGSKSPITRQLALNLIQRFGLRVDPETRARIRTDTTDKTNNMSVVTVTADLPAFARNGQTIDVLVSTFDDAKNLAGGQLIMTPLKAVDGEVYAVASGAISTGGFAFSGDAAGAQKNHPTTGRIPNGATIERETCTPIGQNGIVRLLLRQSDYETARRIALAINTDYPSAARAADSTTVEIHVPTTHTEDIPGFIGRVGTLTVIPDRPARVVINERTGTVIIGENVRLARVLITHANLSITTAETPEVSQPNPFSQGQTTTVPRTQMNIIEEKSFVNEIEQQSTVGDLARALNALGVTPRDLSSIFQQLKESGSLHAELLFK